jgi:hypothetical protein
MGPIAMQPLYEKRPSFLYFVYKTKSMEITSASQSL